VNSASRNNRVMRATLIVLALVARSGLLHRLKAGYAARLEEAGVTSGVKVRAAYRAVKTVLKYWHVVYRIGFNLPLTLPYDADKLGKLSEGLPKTDDGVYLPECGEWLDELGVRYEPRDTCVEPRRALLELAGGEQ